MSREKELILEASLCWDPKPSGIFESELASKIADKLEQSLFKEV